SGVSRNLVFFCGVLGLAASAWLAFGQEISTLAEAVIFSIISGASLAAVATAFPGTAQFSLGKLIKGTGILAVLMFIIVLVFQAMHLIQMKDFDPFGSDQAWLGDAIQYARSSDYGFLGTGGSDAAMPSAALLCELPMTSARVRHGLHQPTEPFRRGVIVRSLAWAASAAS